MKRFFVSFMRLSVVCFALLLQAAQAAQGDILFTAQSKLPDTQQLHFDLDWKNKGSLSMSQVNHIEQVILNGLYNLKNVQTQLSITNITDTFSLKIGVSKYNFSCEVVFSPPASVTLGSSSSARCQLSLKDGYVLSIQ